MQMIYDDELNENASAVDVCPSCGALIDTVEELTEGCNDPMGCGAFLDVDDEEEDGLEELNFDN